MHSKLSRRHCLFRLLQGSVGVTTMAATGGCGSILYPERIGQPRGGPIDWKVVALDGVGLMLFFVPGIVAFAVDFYNGTIFLPSGHYGEYAARKRPELVSVTVPPKSLDQASIERVASEHVGQKVALTSGSYFAQPLKAIDDFWPQTWRLKKDVVG